MPAGLGSVFSGSSTSPSTGLCLYHYPFLQNPKVMRSVLGGLAVRQAEPKVAEAGQMQSEYVEAVGQELLQLTATPRLKLRPLGPEPLGRALGLLPLPVLPWPVAPYLAEPLQCVGAQLSAARGLSPLLITMRGGSTGLGSARARLGRRSGTESSGDASSTDGLPNLAALFSRAPSSCSAADLLGGDFGSPMS